MLAAFLGFISTLMFILLLAKGLAEAVGWDMSWGWILAPLVLLFIPVAMLWALIATVWMKWGA